LSQGLPNQIRNHPPGSSAATAGKLLGSNENIIFNFEGSTHRVNRGNLMFRCYRINASLANNAPQTRSMATPCSVDKWNESNARFALQPADQLIADHAAT
jgi:hypothetical protein